MSDFKKISKEELLDISVEEKNAIIAVCAAAAVTHDFFTSDEWLNDDQRYVNYAVGMRDQMETLRFARSVSHQCISVRLQILRSIPGSLSYNINACQINRSNLRITGPATKCSSQ